MADSIEWDQRMRGWLLISGDFAHHGGMDRANLELARFLSADTHIHLVAHSVPDEFDRNPNVTVHRVPRPYGKHLLGQSLLAQTGRLWASRLSAEGYRVLVNGGNCRWKDANWLHCVHAAYPSSAVGGLSRRVMNRALHSLNRRAERQAIQNARIVICNSRRTSRDAVELLGANPDRLRVVYLGTDASQLSKITPEERRAARSRMVWDDRPWVGFVGQLGNKVKGFNTLYTAWRELARDKHWDANLVVIGEGPDRLVWERRAASDALGGRILFLGFRTDVPAILAGCDVLAAPSLYDAYGLAVHEALCRGLPAIVSAAAGASERYPSEFGDLILTDPSSPGELADRLRHWRANIDSFALRIRPLADVLRARTWADMARDIRDCIESSD
jgi:glycosyltransferase involved in cell wall biosynthesis